MNRSTDAVSPSSKIQSFLPFLLFCCFAGAGVREFFVGDEVMNLFSYLQHPASWWLAGLLRFWSSDYYRPLGGIVHIAVYSAFGFNPLPFKIVLLTALLLNLTLYYRVAAVVSGSRQIALWGLLFCSYHAAFAGLYLNFGTIYDVLGYSCYLGALLAYACWVCGTRWLAGVASVTFLYVAGLEFKEMDVTLPGVLLAYNLLLTRRVQTERFRWPLGSGLPIILCAGLGLVYTFGKMTGPQSLATIADYAPHFTLHEYATISAHYIRQIFYLPSTSPSPTGALWILAMMIVAGLRLRSRLMVFCAVSIVVTQLPVSFMAPRGAFAIYIPFAFWGLYAATLLNSVVVLPGSPRRALAAWLAAAAGLAVVHFHMKPRFDKLFTDQAASYEGFSRQLDDWGVRVPRQGRVLLINDPFPSYWIGWDPMFMINLRSHTTEAVVNRLKFTTFLPPDSELATYDYVIDYDSRWRLLKQPGRQMLPSSHLREMPANTPVQLADGFQPPMQGLWRETAQEFTIKVRCKPGAHTLLVSLVSYSPARLSIQVDNEKPVDRGVQPVPNIELALPIPQQPITARHTFRFHSVTTATPLFFVDGRLH